MKLTLTGRDGSAQTLYLPAGARAGATVDVLRRRAQTPEGMRDRLYAQLVHRAPLVRKLLDYIEGRHAFTFATDGFQDHAKMMAAVADNYCPLVRDASAERIGIQGLSLATPGLAPGADDALANDFSAWDVWRASDLDEHSPMAWKDAIAMGESYFLAEALDANQHGGRDVRITIEHAATMIVLRAAHDPTVILAALKAYQDDWGVEHATLWTPDVIHRWLRADQDWETDGDPEPHPFPGVPVWPIVNDPGTVPAQPPKVLLEKPHGLQRTMAIGIGRSDLLDIIETQDSINALIRDMLITAEYQSFRQRWVVGHVNDVADDEDAEQDPDAPPPASPFVSGPGFVWHSEQEQTKFGEFQEASLEPFIKAHDGRLASLSSRSRLPLHYFVAQAKILPSAETLRGAEAGLVSKTGAKQLPFGGATKRMTRDVLPVYNPTRFRRGAVLVTPQWKDHEVRTESEHVDSTVKKLAAGVPVQQLWIELDYTPDQIAQFRTWLREQAAEAMLADISNPANPGTPAVETDPAAAAKATRGAQGVPEALAA